jgi:SulP family sulfate permease
VARVLTGEFSVPAVFVAAAAFGVFWLIRRLRPGWPEALLGLVLFSLLAQWLEWDALGVRTLGDGGPLFARPPDFAGVPITLRELATVRGLLGPALAIALLGMLEAVSIAKTYGTRAGEAVDTNRELVAMGFGNLASGCFAGMPGSASFARSAANFQAGAASRWAGALSSAFVLVFVVVLAPLVEHVPVPALAAALVRIGWRMIDREQIRVALRTTGSDAVVLVATFSAAMLLPLDIAIYAGVGLALALALRKASSPTLTEYTFTADAQLTQLDDARQRILPRVAIIHVEGELFFGAADLFQDHIRSRAEREDLRVVILRLKNARHIDVTTVFALRSLHDYFRDSGRHLLISGVHGEMLRVLRRSGLFDLIGRDNLFPAEANPNLATRKALLRARELLQTPEADVRIFLQQPA